MLLADAAGIARAAAILRGGELVAVPTETVYGLAAKADSDEAVARIYAAKGRPDFNPLIVHVADIEQARRLGDCDARMERLVERYWPGPLTLVVPLRPDAGLAPAVTAGLGTVALRSPAHPAMRALIEATQAPLAAPSANPSGSVSPTSAAHVRHGLGGGIAAIVDGGKCVQGLESTIVALREGGSWQLLRAGPVTEPALADVLGAASHTSDARIEAPGQLASHYSPGKSVRLGATDSAEDEFMIGFAAVAGDCTLSAVGDLSEAAARLYACLHLAARSDKSRVAVAPVPDEGIGQAINDRLRRAAA